MYLERLVIDNIKRIRKEKGISQEKLAEACNTATSYIGLMEIYRNIPKLSTIERIAQALDVSPLSLFQDINRLSEDHRAELREKKRRFLAVVEKEFDKILLERGCEQSFYRADLL
jgi:transcriptional regulator with XRE-family HTH domain